MAELLAKLPVLLLVSSRMAGVTTASPVFNNKFLPAQIRVALTFLLAFLLLPAVDLAPGTNSTSGLIGAAVLELLVGLLIGFMNQLIFTTIQMAGAWLDLDMGFSMAQVFDPVSGFVEPIIATFLQNLGIVLYLTLGAHHLLIRALVESFRLIPAGGLVATADAPMHVVYLFGTLIGAAIQMVMPFIAVMLMLSVALAGINRAMPAFNIFSLGLGMKAVGGLALMVVLLPYFLGYFESLFTGGHSQLLETLNLLRPGR
ncbi:MAG TPA: flagellar biosynthetic protein FliR [Symbiobacteriaceae bacterium]|jgi:flagellar biosynthetic protein FliR